MDLPIEPLCPKCLQLMRSGRPRNKDNMLYFTCSGDCKNAFMWPEKAYENLPDGPTCLCGRPSYPRRRRRTSGREPGGVWYCAKTSADRDACSFELPIASVWHEQRDQVHVTNRSGDPQSELGSSTGSDAQFLVGTAAKMGLQELFHVDYYGLTDSVCRRTLGRATTWLLLLDSAQKWRALRL